ncbi:hypothetical protein G6F65_014421 [Rhizopus arrhizus]|nr:hypothetical protein G6F65_014421 [Rhizopus arrhizus]
MALVAAEYLKAAGFTVDMQVVDWATLTQRRQDPAVWDIFLPHSVFLPEPALIDFPSKDAPGWWDTPRRAQVMDAFNQARTQEERIKRWADVQQAVPRARRRCKAPSPPRGRSSGTPGRPRSDGTWLVGWVQRARHHRVALSLKPAGRAGGRDVHRRDHRVRHHPRHAWRPRRGDAGSASQPAGHRRAAHAAGAGPAHGDPVPVVAGQVGAGRPGPIHLHEQARAVGAGRPRGTDDPADADVALDRQRHRAAGGDPVRRQTRHHAGSVGAVVLDVHLQRAELLAGPAADADFLGEAGLAARVWLWRPRCIAGHAPVAPDPARRGAGPGEFRADHPLHPRQHAGRAARRLRAHGAGQGPARDSRGRPPHPAQRATSHDHAAGPAGRHHAGRLGRGRKRLCLARPGPAGLRIGGPARPEHLAGHRVRVRATGDHDQLRGRSTVCAA